jgi:ANTAR domain
MVGRDRPPRRDGETAGSERPRPAGSTAPASLGRTDVATGSEETPAAPLPAAAVGEAGPLRATLDRLGAGRLVELVAVLTVEAALGPGRPPGGAALVVAPWPQALDWLGRAAPGAPLGGAVPVLLVGGEPPRACLVVDTPGGSLAAALGPAAGPLAGLAGELASLRAENQVLRDALEARKAIERAKGILMEQEGISEAEAFTRIQRLSMTKRKSMKEISEAIILSRELTGR